MFLTLGAAQIRCPLCGRSRRHCQRKCQVQLSPSSSPDSEQGRGQGQSGPPAPGRAQALMQQPPSSHHCSFPGTWLWWGGGRAWRGDSSQKRKRCSRPTVTFGCVQTEIPVGAGPQVIFKHLPSGLSPGSPSLGPWRCSWVQQQTLSYGKRNPCRCGSWRGSSGRPPPGGLQRQTCLQRGPQGSGGGRSPCPGCDPEPRSTSAPAGRMACGLPPCPAQKVPRPLSPPFPTA